MNEFQMLFYLVGAHFVCDYPLQGEYLANAKSKGPLRIWHLFGHSTIHGAAVSLITGSPILGICETVAHMTIDEGKVRGFTTFGQDQILHIACKAIWVLSLYLLSL